MTAPTAHENQYGVVSSPQSLHNDWIAQANMGTCTGGVCGGDMLVANGGPTANHVWYQTITVTPNMPYRFSGWVTSVLGYTDPNPANLSIGVDLSGACAGTPLTNTFTTVGSLSVDPALTSGQWAQGTASFTSGTSTSICLSLVNNQLAAGGNDFAIDGLSLTAVTTSTSGVTAVPTLSQIGLMLLSLLMGAGLLVQGRRAGRER
ncbi:MAG: IPTL-CTERM sorting domain-containing protein [Pseudomonadota bacterium]|nr:IPTL-CTERM sorting domain-containing protein [Pseudomonadota bacterium]